VLNPSFLLNKKRGLPKSQAERIMIQQRVPVGIGFAESLFTVTDFLDSPK
jgi:hypothetical protein